MTPVRSPDPAEKRAPLSFDPDALRTKYRQERDKRLRADGNEQYVEVKGALARYLDDPYVQPGFTRPALYDEVEVLVVGGGFGGLLISAYLLQAGIDSLRIVEKAGDFGGTWYWNRYPGAQCDVESYIYLPLLEETGYVPKEKYSYAPEILAHARRIGEHFRLYERACFQTQIREMLWEEDSRRWRVSTDRGDRMSARHVILSSGPLNRPKLPGIPGIERFRGHSFHTSRWDYEYTGGDCSGGLTRLADKRVAIIGTGATAIQCVPHLGKHAEQLYVLQRTPSSVDERRNSPTDPEWARGLQPGWQKRRMENFNILVMGGHQDEDLVNDGWTDIIRSLGFFTQGPDAADLSPEAVARAMELADFAKMNQIRARIDSIVKDRATAESLKPWYRQFCKRPTFNDEYLPTFNRPNVRLIDTRGEGVHRISEKGLVFDDVEYEVDCIIFATGFEVGTDYTRRAGFEIYGRGGRSLTDHWKNGLRTLHGLCAHGFPNCFHMGNTQGTLTANFPHMLIEQSEHITAILRAARERRAQYVEPTAAAEEAWVRTIRDKVLLTRDFLASCTPGYYNNEGKLDDRKGLGAEMYGGGSVEFFDLLRKWRAEAMSRDLEIR